MGNMYSLLGAESRWLKLLARGVNLEKFFRNLLETCASMGRRCHYVYIYRYSYVVSKYRRLRVCEYISMYHVFAYIFIGKYYTRFGSFGHALRNWQVERIHRRAPPHRWRPSTLSLIHD